MKDIFKQNNYRFGTETFLLMYLNQYQFVLGFDLENYAKTNDFFTKDNPCNIYFILRRPKVTIDPKTVVIFGNKASFQLIIHHPTKSRAIKMEIEFKKARSEIEFYSKYPYNLFTFSDKNGVLLGARPSTLIDSPQLQNNITLSILDYEVLYIGQAYGKNGERTALDRLSSHETVQKIYTHSLTNSPDSDIWFLLSNFSQQDLLMMAGRDLIKVNEEDFKIETEKLKHFQENDRLAITEKQKINFTEAGLIRYFQPEYNIEFKDSFPTAKHKSYSECYRLDIRALTIELDMSENTRRIYTKNTENKHRHIKMFNFESNKDRISMLSAFE